MSFEISSSLPEINSKTSVTFNLNWDAPKGHVFRFQAAEQ